MIKIDLVTGFLGSGKTTFIRHYARYLLARGERICILENDYGAINIDMVLLKDLLGKNLSLEMVIGGDGQSAHQRHFRALHGRVKQQGDHLAQHVLMGMLGHGAAFHLLHQAFIPRKQRPVVLRFPRLAEKCFPLAEKYRNPVILLTDATLAKMRESVVIPDYQEVPDPRTIANSLTGKKGREAHKVVTCGDGAVQWENFCNTLQEKYKLIAENEVRYQEQNTEDADIILVAYGSMARVCESAMKMAREQGIKVGMIRPISLWPFPNVAFEGKKQKFLVVELSAGQMVQDVKLAVDDKKQVSFFGKLGGTTPSPKVVLEQIKKLVNNIEMWNKA